MNSILIVDDEKNILSSLKTFLTLSGYEVFAAATLETGKRLYLEKRPQITILDVFLQGEDGIELLSFIRQETPQAVVIMISGHAAVKLAIEAIKKGAYDFLEKPIDTEKLKIIIENGLRQNGLLNQLANFKKKWLTDNFIVGNTQPMQEILQLAEKVGSTNLIVLIHGESGVGKEMLAYYIFLNSNNIEAPYIPVNCAAVQPELFESSLFGHKKGAFTGAIADKAGFFQAADGGTLFLDEIGEIPLFLQVKLLRAIEYGEVQGVGYDRPVKVNTRILCATNRNLEQEVEEGRFREDLYFRLNQVPVFLPTLKARKTDIPLFIEKFQKELSEKNGLPAKKITDDGLVYLVNRDYKGNIRELRNLVARVTLMTTGESIGLEDLKRIDTPGRNPAGKETIFERTMPLQEAKQYLERLYLESQLQLFHYSIKDTSAALDILPNNLSRKIAQLGISIHKQG